MRKIDSDDDEDGEYIPPAKVDEDEEMHVLGNDKEHVSRWKKRSPTIWHTRRGLRG